jgi:Zn-finger protein
MLPEDIPEDRCQSFLCSCGGNITKNENGLWECDTCPFIANDKKEQDIIENQTKKGV